MPIPLWDRETAPPEAPPVTVMKEPCLPYLLRAYWCRAETRELRTLLSLSCCLEGAVRAFLGLWEPGFAFHLSSRLVLSSGGAEGSGDHPLGPARDDAPHCRAGHGSPGALVLPRERFPRDSVSYRRWDAPALRRRSSGSSASCGGGMGDALARRGSSGERAGTPARPGSAAASQGFETLTSGTERGERGKVLLCGVKWRLSCRGAGERSPGASRG